MRVSPIGSLRDAENRIQSCECDRDHDGTLPCLTSNDQSIGLVMQGSPRTADLCDVPSTPIKSFRLARLDSAGLGKSAAVRQKQLVRRCGSKGGSMKGAFYTSGSLHGRMLEANRKIAQAVRYEIFHGLQRREGQESLLRSGRRRQYEVARAKQAVEVTGIEGLGEFSIRRMREHQSPPGQVQKRESERAGSDCKSRYGPQKSQHVAAMLQRDLVEASTAIHKGAVRRTAAFKEQDRLKRKAAVSEKVEEREMCWARRKAEQSWKVPTQLGRVSRVDTQQNVGQNKDGGRFSLSTGSGLAKQEEMNGATNYPQDTLGSKINVKLTVIEPMVRVIPQPVQTEHRATAINHVREPPLRTDSLQDHGVRGITLLTPVLLP